MHVAWCGPISLRPLETRLASSQGLPDGYLYPLGAHLVSELLSAGCRVSVITSDKGIRDTLRYSGENLNVSVVNRRSPGACARDFFRQEVRLLHKELAHWSPDIVHAQWTYEFADAGVRSRLPLLVTARDVAPVIFGHVRDTYRFVRMLYSYFVIPRIREITVPSPYLGRQYKNWYLKRGCDVVPNGIGDNRFRAAVKEYRGERKNLVAITGWDGRKNPKVLLKAFAIAREKMPDLRLAIAGSGLEPDGPGADWARTTGVSEGVEFKGRLSHADAIKLLETHAELFVHTTLEESFGMTIVEAIAAGIPVIGGERSGAVPWVLGDGRLGKLVDVRSPQAVATAILEMASASGPATQMAIEALRDARERFSLSSIVASYKKHYGALLKS